MALKAPSYKSIGIRFLILILVVAVPLAAFDYYHAAKEKRRWSAEITADLVVSAREVVNKTNDLITSAQDLLVGLSMTETVRGSDMAACRRLLHDIGARYGKYTNFSVVNRDKFIVCSSGPLPKPVDVSKSSNIVDAFRTKAFAVSPFKFGVLTGKPTLVFSQPLLDARGDAVGTINTGLSLTWLGEYLADIVKFPDERMVVFDGEGTVLASYPDNLHPIGSSIAGSPVMQMANGLGTRGTGQGAYTDINGAQMLAAVSRVEQVPGGAYIAAFTPVDLVLADVTAALYQRLAVLGALVALSIVVGWVGVRILLLNPVDRLIEVTGRLQEGDLQARSGIRRDGSEMGLLAEAYDKMADALYSRTEALKNSETNYRELVESGGQLVHRYRPDTTELFVNTTMAKFFGGMPGDWLGRKWIDYIPAIQRRDIESLMRTCTADDPTFVYEHQVRNAAGEDRWLRWINRAFFDADGNVSHFQAVGIDLTERKHAEAALERAMMDARAASQAKSNFLANMSHELRTPLNSIIGFSEMMSSEMMGKLPKTYHEYAGYITTSGHHLLNIINDLLDLSKIEAGVMKLEETDVDLAGTVNEVVDMLKTLAASNNNDLITQLDSDKPLHLLGDRLRIKQVLLNVVSNALKFTTGGVVKVEVLNEDEALVLRVIDDGIGMSEHDISIALSPFGQVDGHHLNKRFEGTGLGLPLAEQLMEMHQGHLEIESELGEGTTVTLRFPRERTVPFRS